MWIKKQEKHCGHLMREPAQVEVSDAPFELTPMDP